eukprot:572735-Rhodomonas_salina.2
MRDEGGGEVRGRQFGLGVEIGRKHTEHRLVHRRAVGQYRTAPSTRLGRSLYAVGPYWTWRSERVHPKSNTRNRNLRAVPDSPRRVRSCAACAHVRAGQRTCVRARAC